ncbi:hypothetical protein GWN26_03845, partial [Candidatus Saccharibacteria bacterium]|nr:hypothetical protein [Calditrichia bacterium]NIV98314.1 hypothetical protein [Candidatus Saccharibacteria bacterium]NIW79587.1 hypothetical protein [Calditrichia bacterium]
MSNNIKISARAPGKLILLGEYAVLEGAPAIVAAINRAANVGIHPSADHHFRVEAPTLNFSPLLFSVDKSGKITLSEDVAAEIRQKLKFFKVTFETVGQELIKYNHTLSPVDILLDTSEFFLKHRQIKLGFGSSAALTIALLAALQGYYKKRVVTADNRWLFFKFAMQIHRTAQGNVGSGVDVAASAFGGILQYQLTNVEDESPASINRLALPENLYTLFIWTGKSA